MNVEPVILQGPQVRLVPLSLDHLDALCAIGLDEELWRWTGGRIETADEMRAYIERALAREDALPFATTLRETGEVVGCTRFGNIAPEHRRVEIGWTWVARKWQRTFVNTEAKFLMLRHAFETWKCHRVEIVTHARNEASRQAIERIGATLEGILRRHRVQPDGTIRDTALYAIVDGDWAEVRADLLRLMSAS